MFFFAQKMLRLSGLASHRKTRGDFFCFCYMKFLNLVCQLSFSSTVGMEAVLQKTLGGQFSVTVEVRNKNPAV